LLALEQLTALFILQQTVVEKKPVYSSYSPFFFE
jgi:hypothetical protein